jgi:hypothetical protein
VQKIQHFEYLSYKLRKYLLAEMAKYIQCINEHVCIQNYTKLNFKFFVGLHGDKTYNTILFVETPRKKKNIFVETPPIQLTFCITNRKVK